MIRTVLVVGICSLLALTLHNGKTLAAEKPETFLASFFVDGAPEISPLNRLSWTDIKQAQISVEGATGLVVVVWGKDGKGKDRFWVAGLDDIRNVRMTTGSMKRGDSDVYSGSVDLKTLGATQGSVNVEIRVILSHGLLLYRQEDQTYSASVRGDESGETHDNRLKWQAQIPDFRVQLLNGDSLAIADLRGGFVVINWWATTCSPCIAEMPGLNELVEKYSGNDDISFLAIATDKREDLSRFLESRKFAYTQALYNETVTEIFGNALPRNVIINPSGEVVYDQVGGSPTTHKILDEAIERLMAQ
ncbi:MAG: TlpA disulfide reductase family protein [Gemmatimonadota bacterium]|nr:TlpA disulfide reductase family protein [Gemmatimonadota bacterium]